MIIWFDTFFVNAVPPSPLAYSSGDTLDYVEPCLPCASVSVETLKPLKTLKTQNPKP